MFKISDLRRREILHLKSMASVCFSSRGKGEGGSTLLFAYYFFQKTEYFGGQKILRIFLGVITKLDYI